MEQPPQPGSAPAPSFYCQSQLGLAGPHLVPFPRVSCWFQWGSGCGVSAPFLLLHKQTRHWRAGLVFLLTFFRFIISLLHIII